MLCKMSLFRQSLRIGLAISTFLFSTLLFFSYAGYLKVPTNLTFRARTWSNVLDKKLSSGRQVLQSIAEERLKDSTTLQNITAASNGELEKSKAKNMHCVAKTSIVFFKMHKCSSSTVQNILFRYGEQHKLDFVLPMRGNYLGNSLEVFRKGFMMQFPVEKYNILCHHTRFSYKGMKEVMASNAVFTTIIRDPVAMYESVFTYNEMANLYHLPPDKALEIFLENPEHYYNIAHGVKMKAKNPMLSDLGLEEKALGNERKIKQKIEQLKKQFDLVLLTEYFEESLILLRKFMCWELDDVVFFVLNARNKSSIKDVSPQMADKIRKWNSGDVKLYETFNQTFWRKVKAFGYKRMKEEVAKLRDRNQYFQKHCIAKVVSKDSAVWHPSGININSFRLKPEALEDKMCVQMARTELPYSDHIRDIQVSRYGIS